MGVAFQEAALFGSLSTRENAEMPLPQFGYQAKQRCWIATDVNYGEPQLHQGTLISEVARIESTISLERRGLCRNERTPWIRCAQKKTR